MPQEGKMMTEVTVCVCVCVLVAQLCLTLCDPMDCRLSGSSVHEILQARILEWVAIPFSSRCSWPGDWIWISFIVGRFFTIWATKEGQGYITYIQKWKKKKYCRRQLLRQHQWTPPACSHGSAEFSFLKRLFLTNGISQHWDDVTLLKLSWFTLLCHLLYSKVTQFYTCRLSD